MLILATALFLTACGEQKPVKNLPKEIVSPTPFPYTGEPGQQKTPQLKVYQVNEDGTSQETGSFGGGITDVSTTPAKP